MTIELKYPHTLLLVDDEASILTALRRLFRREGYEIVTADSGQSALEKLAQASTAISLIISDQRMPVMTGSQFLEQALTLAPEAMRFILTGYADFNAIIDAVNKGKIHRYMPKPWNDEELLGQVRSALAQVELRFENQRLTILTEQQNEELSILNKSLEKKVDERTWALQYQNKKLQQANTGLEKSLMDTIRLLVSFVESSNPKLGAYMKTVAHLARELAAEAGLDQSEQNKIEMAGLVHDIGLLGLADPILEKDKKIMTPEEFATYSQHPVIAALSLSSVERLKEIGDMVLAHHENADGSGFPRGLKENQLPMGAKILALAADYQTMIQLWPKNTQRLLSYARRYLDADTVSAVDINDKTMREQVAEKIIQQGTGTRYSLAVVQIFLKKMAGLRPYQEVMKLPLQALRAGMILMQDLRLEDGRLLLPRGTVFNDRSVHSIQGISNKKGLEGLIEVAEPQNSVKDGKETV